MTKRNTNTDPNRYRERKPDSIDLNTLLHPARAFAHPKDVVGDCDLTLNEKRAILSSWAADICAVEAAPMLRQPPGGGIVQFDDIMDALRELDREAGHHYRPPPRYRRVLENRIPRMFGRKSGGRRSEEGGSPSSAAI